MIKLKIALLFCTIILLAGCATEANYQRKLASSIGMSEQQLIKEFGEPIAIRHFELGAKKMALASYSKKNDVYLEESQPSYVTNIDGKNIYTKKIKKVEFSCSTTFTIENDKVIQFKYHGNNCVSYSFF
ncbi:hypothetical protein RHO13_02185 [Orbus wheelerorum]|uniref:hypothetical protein n=1 Tax=Orbus wheelerorum TaxID=3074111 RepID=UPI00370D5766